MSPARIRRESLFPPASVVESCHQIPSLGERDGIGTQVFRQPTPTDGKDGFLFGETPGADGKKKFFSTKKDVADGRVKPAGEWNTLEITARGKTLTLWVNGAVTCQFGDCGNPRGLVGLEGEGYRIEFRNLKVKELR